MPPYCVVAPSLTVLPSLGSGFPYPVPWNLIPENIYLNFRFISSMLFMPAIRKKQALLKAHGLKDPIKFFGLHRPDVPWLTQTMPEASRPVDVVPQNVTCTWPITLSLGSAEEQDPALAAWLARAPTVLVNLGGGFIYHEPKAIAMANGLAEVLRNTDVQILWKFQRRNLDAGTWGEYSDEFLRPLQPFLDNERIKVESWISIDPTSLLESGHIIASVHHGGAGCYHETIRYMFHKTLCYHFRAPLSCPPPLPPPPPSRCHLTLTRNDETDLILNLVLVCHKSFYHSG